MSSGETINAMTVDVEDWFQVSVLRNKIRFEDWHRQECRIQRNIDRILTLFSEHKVKGTFFVLGWIAEHFPQVVKDIKAEGHEIGCHSYAHKVIFEHSREDFVEDLHRSTALIEDLTGNPIEFYRAPSWSITRDSLWALEVLVERGFKYDSSLFPVRHDLYGIEDVPRFPFYMEFVNGGKITEFPPSTLRIAGNNVPFAGGGYLRLFPYTFVKQGIRSLNRKGHPVVFYFHPWEIDPGQPRVDIKGLSKIRHYTNLEETENRLRDLVKSFKFSTLSDVMRQAPITLRWPDFNGVHERK